MSVLEKSGVEKNNKNLMFNEEKISLNWLYKIWLESEMCGDLWNSKLTLEHFVGKSPHNQMRSFLEFQVYRDSMIELTKSYADRVHGIKNYSSNISILERVIGLINIINSTRVKSVSPSTHLIIIILMN